MNTRIGPNIKQKRVTLGADTATIAKAANCSPSYLEMIEGNHVIPTLEALTKIAQALGCPIDELLH